MGNEGKCEAMAILEAVPRTDQVAEVRFFFEKMLECARYAALAGGIGFYDWSLFAVRKYANVNDPEAQALILDVLRTFASGGGFLKEGVSETLDEIALQPNDTARSLARRAKELGL